MTCFWTDRVNTTESCSAAASLWDEPAYFSDVSFATKSSSAYVAALGSDAAGSIYAAISETSGGHFVIISSTDYGETWGSEVDVSGLVDTPLGGGAFGTTAAYSEFGFAVKSGGTALIAVANSSTKNYDVLKTTNYGASWAAVTSITTGATDYLGKPWAIVLPSGRILFAWLHQALSSGSALVKVAYTDNNGTSWTVQTVISYPIATPFYEQEPIFAVLGSGRLVVNVWTADTSPAYYCLNSYSDNNGTTWSADTDLGSPYATWPWWYESGGSSGNIFAQIGLTGSVLKNTTGNAWATTGDTRTHTNYTVSSPIQMSIGGSVEWGTGIPSGEIDIYYRGNDGSLAETITPTSAYPDGGSDSAAGPIIDAGDGHFLSLWAVDGTSHNPGGWALYLWKAPSTSLASG